MSTLCGSKAPDFRSGAVEWTSEAAGKLANVKERLTCPGHSEKLMLGNVFSKDSAGTRKILAFTSIDEKPKL